MNHYCLKVSFKALNTQLSSLCCLNKGSYSVAAYAAAYKMRAQRVSLGVAEANKAVAAFEAVCIFAGDYSPIADIGYSVGAFVKVGGYVGGEQNAHALAGKAQEYFQQLVAGNITTIKAYEPARLVCLFGCGGNRAKARRYEMGEVSSRFADLTVITSDNPRDEEPMDIINDILVGVQKADGAYVMIPDRKEAIKYCMENAQDGDIVVLAGKGHEDYQEIKGVKYFMDERDLIADIIAENPNLKL